MLRIASQRRSVSVLSALVLQVGLVAIAGDGQRLGARSDADHLLGVLPGYRGFRGDRLGLQVVNLDRAALSALVPLLRGPLDLLDLRHQVVRGQLPLDQVPLLF